MEIVKIYRQLESDLAALIGEIPFSARINLKLERITHLLELLGNPHHAFQSVHVGGTSGKGSTATTIAALLTAANHKTGLHVSPHLQILNERHQINGLVTPTSRLAALFEEIKPLIAQVGESNPFGTPSYFEAQVALMFYLFQQEGVETAVIEVGLGGTLDSTNVVPASVAVLTSVGLDHTAILGDTIAEIAQDKAGIIKAGQTVVSGVQHTEAQAIIAARCQEVGATLWQIGQHFSYAKVGERRFALQLPAQTVHFNMGTAEGFQIQNTAVALAAAYALLGVSMSEDAIQQALTQIHLPARMEVLQKNPTVLLDGAHNPDKISAAAHAVAHQFPDKSRIVVLGLKKGKAADDILPHVLTDKTRLLILTAFYKKGLWNPHPPEDLAEIARRITPGLEIAVVVDPLTAVSQAIAAAEPNDLIWITGSLYLAGDVRAHWYPIEEMIERAEIGLPGSLQY